MTEKYDLSGPDPERPLMMIRLSAGHAEPKIWDRLFPVLKQNRACCDEVWFSTGVGVPAETPVVLPLRQTPAGAEVAVPALDPWGIAWLEIG